MGRGRQAEGPARSAASTAVLEACGQLEKNMEKRIAQLEKIIQRQQFIEDRYEELMLSCRRCWRYYGADQELFTASMKAMDFLIRRHATEIDEMNEEDNDDRPDNLPSNAGGKRHE